MSSKNWRSKLKKVDAAAIAKAQETIRGGSGFRLDCLYTDSRYVPPIDSSKLPKDHYKGGFFPVRLLPPTEDVDYDQPVFSVYKYQFYSKFGRGFDNVDCAKTTDPKWTDSIKELQSLIYQDGSERAKQFAKGLYPQVRHFLAVAVRKIELINRETGEKKYYNNMVRVLSLPDKPVSNIIFPAWHDEEIGIPTDIDAARDLRLHVEINMKPIGNKDVKVPEYDKSKWAMELTPLADTEDEMEDIYHQIPDLSEEYEAPDSKKLDEMATKLYDMFKGKDTSRSFGVSGNRDSEDETGDDEDIDEKPSRSRRFDEDDDEDDRPSRRQTSSRNDDEDEEVEERPRTRSRRVVESDDEDDAPTTRRRSSSEDDEDDTPKRRTRSVSEDDDEDEKPRRRRSAVSSDDEEDEDEPPRRRRPVSDEEDDDQDEDAPKPLRRRSSSDNEPKASKKPVEALVSGDDDDDDEDAWFSDRLNDIDPQRKNKDD